MSKFEIDLLLKVQWEIWHQDNFDLDTPRQIVAAGEGLVQGLIELWARHLFETIQPDGNLGFSKYNLWWIQRKISIEIVGDLETQKKLRDWIYGERMLDTSAYLDSADLYLLTNIAEIHSKLILKGQNSQEIVETAKASVSGEDFIGLINCIATEM